MKKTTKTPMAIPYKLFLFNVEDIDAVSRLFNGSICYALTWKGIWKTQSQGSKVANLPTSDEQLLLACNYLLQTIDGLPTTSKGRHDVAVVLNPARKYLDVREMWLTYSTAVFIRGGRHMEKLYEIEKRLSANDLLEAQIDEIRQILGVGAIRKYVPFVKRFSSDVHNNRKLIATDFRRQFVI